MDAVTNDCPEEYMELSSMLRYRRFLIAQWEQPSVTATLVAFHNIVTNSIDPKWHLNGRHRLHCLANAIREVPPSFIDDIDVASRPTAEQLLNGLPEGTPWDKVMGLGPDAFSLRCPLQM